MTACVQCLGTWGNVFTSRYTLKFWTRSLAGTASGMAGDSVSVRPVFERSTDYICRPINYFNVPVFCSGLGTVVSTNTCVIT